MINMAPPPMIDNHCSELANRCWKNIKMTKIIAVNKAKAQLLISLSLNACPLKSHAKETTVELATSTKYGSETTQ